MKLYHYSRTNIKDKIKVKYFGNNSYTFNDKKYNIDRSFFYIDDNIPEYKLKNCKYKYTVEIDKNKIYDLKVDKLNLKYKYNDITKLLQYIKDNYIGCLYNVGFDIVVLFYDIEYQKKEVVYA